MQKSTLCHQKCRRAGIRRISPENPEVNSKHKRRVIIMSAVSIVMVTWLILFLENLPK